MNILKAFAQEITSGGIGGVFRVEVAVLLSAVILTPLVTAANASILLVLGMVALLALAISALFAASCVHSNMQDAKRLSLHS